MCSCYFNAHWTNKINGMSNELKLHKSYDPSATKKIKKFDWNHWKEQRFIAWPNEQNIRNGLKSEKKCNEKTKNCAHQSKAICSETNFETAHDETINMDCSCARAHKNHRYINYVYMKKSALIAWRKSE